MLIGRKTIGTIGFMGGVPSLPTPFVWCWTQMIQFNNEYFEDQETRINYDRATVSWHPFARNSLVDRMQGDWLLMLDTDHTFEPDIALRMWRMMDKYGIDVLTTPYVYKAEPHPPVLYGYSKKKGKFIIGDWERGEGKEIMQIRSSGGGCLMVNKTVFDKIKKKIKQNPFDTIGDISEDHSFFDRIWKLRIKAWAAMNMEVGHLVYKPLTFKDYDVKNQAIDYKNKIYLDSPLKT